MSSLVPPLPAKGRVLPTKVVLRLLPPTITEQEVLEVVPKEFEFDYSSFVPGRRLAKPSPENPNLNARMYFAFKEFQIASEFITKLHGKVLSDAKGTAYRIVAAFAPFQRTPRTWKQLKNPHEGTIESVDHFKNFINNQTTPQTLDVPKQVEPIERRPDYVSPLVASMTTKPNRRPSEEPARDRAPEKAAGTTSKSKPKTPPKQLPEKVKKQNQPKPKLKSSASQPIAPS